MYILCGSLKNSKTQFLGHTSEMEQWLVALWVLILCIVQTEGYLRPKTCSGSRGGPANVQGQTVRAVKASNRLAASSGTTAQQQDKIDLLYDSECPICMMEVNFLQKRDVQGRIRFTDLSSPDYDPADHGNVTFRQGMRKLRAVLPGGEVVTGVEVFRKTYDAIGLGWIFALTNNPVIGGFADKVYDVWAENRLRITGRHDLAAQLAERSKNLAETESVDDCDKEGCAIDWEAEGGGSDPFMKDPKNWENSSGGDSV